MITLRATIIILFCFIVAVCTKCSCCKCDEVKTKTPYRFQEIHLTHIDNSGSDTITSTTKIVDKDAYAIRVDLLSLVFATANKRCNFPALFINEANAFQPGCRCDNYELVPAQKIKSFAITDLNSFDALASGTDITEKFKYYTSFKSDNSEKKYISVKEYLQHYFPYASTSYFLNTNGSLERTFVLFLMDSPVKAGSHQFKVTITLEDNSTIEQTSETITLQ